MDIPKLYSDLNEHVCEAREIFGADGLKYTFGQMSAQGSVMLEVGYEACDSGEPERHILKRGYNPAEYDTEPEFLASAITVYLNDRIGVFRREAG